MEWFAFGHNTFVNEDKTVVKAYSLLDLPKNLPFYGNLENLENFKVILAVEGIGSITEKINRKYVLM